MFRRRSKGSNTARRVHEATGAPEYKYVSAIGKGEIKLDLGKGKKKADPFGGVADGDDPTEDTTSEDDRLIRAAVSALGKEIDVPEHRPGTAKGNSTNKFSGQVVDESEDERSRSVRFTSDTKPAAPVARATRSRSLMGGTLVTPKAPVGPTINPLLLQKPNSSKDAPDKQPKSKSKVGKANLARDIPIFLGVMGALFGIALLNADIGSTKGPPTIKGSLNQAKDALEKAHERQRLAMEAKRQVDCNLFLADSSIPGAGHGLFVAKSYKAGDEVVPVNGALALQEHLMMLVKHHPLVANVDEKGKALMELLPGDELFVAAAKHPTTMESASVYWQQHVSIPTYSDYELADEIIADEIRTQGVAKRVKRNSMMGPSSGDGGGGGTAALRLIKRTVARLQPRVAQLLPDSSGDLLRRKSLNNTSALHAMKVPDVDRLELHGHCLDMNVTATDADSPTMLATRSVKEGKLIVTIPLVLSLVDQEQHHPTPCFGSSESSLELCPLLSRGSMETTREPAEANAKLEWSVWNEHNKQAMDASLDEVLNQYLTKLSLDVIATGPISPGDRVRVLVSDATEDSDAWASLVDYPDSWKFKVVASQQEENACDAEVEQSEACLNTIESPELGVTSDESES